jgi:serine/alanine adding enzyme
MNIQTISTQLTKEQTTEIDAFIKSHRHNTVFQSPAYFSFYYKVPNFKPYYFVIKDEDRCIKGVLLAVLIREGNMLMSFFSARCVIYGGPLVQDDNPDSINQLLRAVNKTLANRCLFTQFRNFRSWPIHLVDVFTNNGFVLRPRLNLITDVADSWQTLAQMSASRRSHLRKGLAAGTEIRPASSIKEVKELYALLHQLYRNKVRKPLPKWPFFKLFYEQLMNQGKGIILLVWFEQKIIGGIVAPITPGKTISELYIVGLDQDYKKQYPSILATWAAMDYAAHNHLQQFDFMGLGKPDVPYGVRDFKLRFGGRQVNYGRFARRNYKVLYSIAEFAYNILRQFKRV